MAVRTAVRMATMRSTRAFARPRPTLRRTRARTAKKISKNSGRSSITRRADLRGRTPAQREYLKQIISHDVTFGIGPAGTGKTYLAVACAVDALERDQVKRIVLNAARGRSRRTARLFARRSRAEGRPVFAAAVRRAVRPARLRQDRENVRTPDDRNRAARLYARPDAEPRVHHPRRSAEHHAGADENVPHTNRFRLEGGGNRRYDPGPTCRAATRAG